MDIINVFATQVQEGGLNHEMARRIFEDIFYELQKKPNKLSLTSPSFREDKGRGMTHS